MRFDFFMIKRTVDNRQVFVHKESLTVSLWFCMLVLQFTSRMWKNYFLKTIIFFYIVFEENAGLILVDFVIFLLLHANPPACLKIVVGLASLQVQINKGNTHK